MKDAESIDQLAQACAAELETVQNYLANSVWLDGLRAQEISESLAEELTEELGHAQKLAHRLRQLGACPPASRKLERRQKSLQPPVDSTDVSSAVQGMPDAENEAIGCYQQIINACEGSLFEGFLKILKKENLEKT